MYELKKNGKVFTSKFFRTGPSSYEKRIYRAAVSQRLRNTAISCLYATPPDDEQLLVRNMPKDNLSELDY